MGETKCLGAHVDLKPDPREVQQELGRLGINVVDNRPARDRV